MSFAATTSFSDAGRRTTRSDAVTRITRLRMFVRRTPERVLLAVIAAYQRFLSPVLPVVTLGACACRFAPTCSQYAAEAIQTHGVFGGSWLALRRLVKCTPLHPGGIDFVPPRTRPVCRKVPDGPTPLSLS